MRPSCNTEISCTNLPVTQCHNPQEIRPPLQSNYTFIYTSTTLPFPVPGLSRPIRDISKYKSYCSTSIYNCIFDSFKSINSSVETITLDSIPYYHITNASHNPKVQGFHKRMVGFRVSTEENLLRRKEQNVFYFTRKTSEFHKSYMIKTFISNG